MDGRILSTDFVCATHGNGSIKGTHASSSSCQLFPQWQNVCHLFKGWLDPCKLYICYFLYLGMQLIVLSVLSLNLSF